MNVGVFLNYIGLGVSIKVEVPRMKNHNRITIAIIMRIKFIEDEIQIISKFR